MNKARRKNGQVTSFLMRLSITICSTKQIALPKRDAQEEVTSSRSCDRKDKAG
jgi:hypothetical protein